MRYTIYRGNEIVVQNIHPEGTVTTKIMGEETAALSFTLPFDITFKLEDRIQIYGKNFFLADTPTIDKKSSREYIYTMSFLSLKYTLRDIQLMFYDENNELTMPATPFMGTAEKALDMVMLNIARLQPGWTKGVVDETEVKNVEFTECNCLEALSKIAETFELEFWVDDDKSIHFTERKPVSGYSFEYGKGKGLKNINRKPLEGASIVTRLYVKGSEKNLPKNYRNGQKNLRMDVPYLEKNTDIYGVKEHTETFDVYPKYEGTVTAVDADPHRFIDTGIDFDLNAYDQYGTTVLMNGVNVKVIFQTGQLAGYTLELLEAGGFNYNTKTFYLQTNKDEKAMEVPSDLLRPAVGDKYILEDLMMPAQYVTNAEAEVKTKGQEYLDQNCKDRFQYSMGSDRRYFKDQNVNLVLGSTVHFKDAAFALDDDIRVTSLSVDIQDPYEVKFDLNESSAVSSIVQSYYDQQSQQTTIINTVKYNAELARRNYLFAREFHDNVFDGEGYYKMENLRYLSIDTKFLSLGSRMQQFALPGVDFKLANNNAMINTAGKLSHQTVDPDGIRQWNIAANSVIGISNNFNYIYIKAQRVGTNANFVVTEAQIKVEQDPDFYYFEVGYLSSVIDGYRKIKTTYGFAQLNPAELSIGRISDPTGNNYIDLLQDRISIKAKVEFTADSPAIGQVINNVQIGGRNLILNSDTEIIINRPSSGYTDRWIKCSSAGKIDNIQSATSYTLTIVYENLNYDKSADFETIVLGKVFSNADNWSLRFYFSDFIVKDVGNNHRQAIGTLTAPVGAYILNNNLDLGFIVNSNNNGIKIYSLKLEKGNKATDWTPAPEDVAAATQAAQSSAAAANSLLSDIANDNKLTPSEKQLLKKEYDQINAEKPQLVSQAQTYGVSVTSYVNAHTALVTYTNPLLVNLNTTSDIVGSVLRSTYSTYYTSKVNLLKAITDKVDNDFDGVYNEIRGLKEDLETEINDVRQNLDDFDQYVQGSFQDGLISQAEAVAIQKYINQINTEKTDLQGQYNIIYNNIKLSGTPKTELLTAWTTYDTAHTNLLNSINTAIADSMTTAVEKADVDSKFTSYRQALATLTQKFQNALNAIETQSITDIQVGGRNFVLNSKDSRSITSPSSGFNQYDWQTVTPSADTTQEFTLSFLIKKNNETPPFTSIVLGKLNGGDAWSFRLYYSDFEITTYADNFNLYTKTFKIGATQTLHNWLKIICENSGSSAIIKNIKLERGNKATDWTPAPEDVDSAISTANAAAANALAQAQNAQNTAAAVQQITSFMQSTVLGNVMATGSLLVGDVNGGNGGITGVTDQGSSSVRFWTGAIYANKNRARWTMCDDGIERCYYPNGQLSSERGYDALNNRFLYNMYDSIGNPIFMLDTVRGLIAPTYIDETYLIVPLFNFGLSSETLDVNAAVTKIQNTGISHIIQQKEVQDENGLYITVPYHIVSLITNYTAYDYNNGTKPTNQQYAYLAGYKASKNRTDNIPNGWYIRYYGFVQYEMPGQTFSRNSGAVITYYKDGVVYKTQSISFVIPVGVNG